MITSETPFRELDLALKHLGARLSLFGRGDEWTAIVVVDGLALYGTGKRGASWEAINASLEDLKQNMEKKA